MLTDEDFISETLDVTTIPDRFAFGITGRAKLRVDNGAKAIISEGVLGDSDGGHGLSV